MIPEGFFKFCVETPEELLAALIKLEQSGIYWRTGGEATKYYRYLINELPITLEVGYDMATGFSTGRELTWVHTYSEFERRFTNAIVYPVSYIIGDAELYK